MFCNFQSFHFFYTFNISICIAVLVERLRGKEAVRYFLRETASFTEALPCPLTYHHLHYVRKTGLVKHISDEALQ